MTLTFTDCSTDLIFISEELELWSGFDTVTFIAKKNGTQAYSVELTDPDVTAGVFTIATADLTISDGVWEFYVQIEKTDETVVYDRHCAFLTCDDSFDCQIVDKVEETGDQELMLYYYILTSTQCNCFCDKKVNIYNWILNRLEQC
jgi:hypothetical protein